MKIILSNYKDLNQRKGTENKIQPTKFFSQMLDDVIWKKSFMIVLATYSDGMLQVTKLFFCQMKEKTERIEIDSV